MYTFDGPNRLIILDAGTTFFTVIDLYSRWKDWAQLSDNAKYLPAFADSVGGDPLGGGTQLGSYFFLQNGWIIRPQEADHTLTVQGNLFPIPDTASLFTTTQGEFTVAINLQTSSLTQAIATGGSTVTVQQIADAVWDESLSEHTIDGSASEELKKTKTAASNAFAVSI